MTDSIQYRQDGHVGYLLLNNPAKHNALGEEQLLEIQRVLGELSLTDGPRVLVVTGAGERTFCAGASLQEMNSGRISGELFQETTDQLAALHIPTIAALNGNVFGGGVELALSCDFRIGVHGSRLRVPAAAIGLCYPISGISRFVQRLGVTTAKRLLLAAEELSAQQMLELGFVEQLVDSEALAQAADKRASDLATLAPLSQRAMKQVINSAASGSLDLGEARRLSRGCLESDDLQEGFAAQRERRAPRFMGR